MCYTCTLNGSIISNSSELSNAFQDHFSTIEPRLANEIPLNDNNNHDLSYFNNINVNQNKFSFPSSSSSIAFSHLNKLCRSKATGLDNISTDLISISLCDLFNKSLLSGIFPNDWKCARVTPSFKQREASDLNNYRPISVISVIAKVFERIVYDQCIIFWAMKISFLHINRAFHLFSELQLLSFKLLMTGPLISIAVTLNNAVVFLI